MSESLAIVYLVLLLVLLGGASWLIFRQILRARRVERELADLQKQVGEGQGTAQTHYELASIYLRKKLYGQAIAQLQKALKAKEGMAVDSTAIIHNALGYAYAAQAQYDLAIRQYKEALKQAPDYVTALNNLGFAYEKKQLTAQALATYEEALKLDPQNATAKRWTLSLQKRLG